MRKTISSSHSENAGILAFSGNRKDRDERGCGTGNIKRGHKAWVTIPYIRCLSENIKNILEEHGVTAFYKPQNTLRQQLVKVKDKQPVEKRSNLVYGITCGGEGCTETYVGETLQSIRARLKQHQRPNSNPAQIQQFIVTLRTRDTCWIQRESRS